MKRFGPLMVMSVVLLMGFLCGCPAAPIQSAKTVTPASAPSQPARSQERAHPPKAQPAENAPARDPRGLLAVENARLRTRLVEALTKLYEYMNA